MHYLHYIIIHSSGFGYSRALDESLFSEFVRVTQDFKIFFYMS